MRKKVIVIKKGDKPVIVADLRDLDIMDFIALKKEAEINKRELIEDYNSLKAQIAELTEAVLQLKAEIDYLKGE